MKAIFPPTLSWYFARQYGLNFLMLLCGLLAIIYIFDMIELLRRVSDKDNVSLSLVLKMGIYKLPEVGQLIFPFAILFSAMWTFWQLTRKHELVIVRAAGLSVWQFILPIVLTGFVIGLLSVMAINPLGAIFVSKFERLEAQYISKKSSAISLSEQGLWLRQNYEDGQAILHADKIIMPYWTLSDVTVFFFSENNDFIKRIDSSRVFLDDQNWNFKYAVSNTPGQLPQTADDVKIPTELTIADLEGSFSSPETISFWRLPEYINIMEDTGFDSTPLKIHFQNLLAQPLLFIAMILLAASVSLRPQRLRGTSILVFSGILIGFLVFFTSSFLQALGGSAQIPIFIASWFPAIISLLLGVGAMMVLEDG